MKIIVYNILLAMKFLHHSNVIHRDLKPANILVDPVTLDVKICDLGLARTMPENTLKKAKERGEVISPRH